MAVANVVIVGGGFAALEAALALRALAGDRVAVTLISPDPTLRYRPAATVEAFAETLARSYDLPAIAADVKASYHRARVESVASRERYVHLTSGARLEYDALILATGARAIAGIPGALTFRDQRDVPMFRRLLREFEAGAIRRLVLAVPSGCSWPLPLYELALLSATHVEQHRVEAEISLVSPEPSPLAMFGAHASRLVDGVLRDRGVRFVGGEATAGLRRDGWLALSFAGPVRADRVVSAPELRGQRIRGVPASRWGFVATDIYGRVEGLPNVYAAGDMTTFPIKQGGLAAQQADRIAHTIAAALGAPVKEFRAAHVLRARLVGGARPLVLRTELDCYGQPTTATLEHADRETATAVTKVFGRYLTPYLEAREPLAPSPLAAA